MELQLQGKVALILGATSEVSAATARLLARAGMRLALLDRSGLHVRELAQSIEQEGAMVSRAQVDIANPASVAASVAEALQPFGGHIDVLVNNTGGCPMIPQEAFLVQQKQPTPAWQDLSQVAFFGYLYTIMQVWPLMRKQQSGIILNMVPDMASCSLSTAVHAHVIEESTLLLTQDLADAFAPFGIHLAWIDRWSLATRLWGREEDVLEACLRPYGLVYDSIWYRDEYTPGVVIPPLVRAEDLARLLTFLISGLAKRRPASA